MDFIDLGRQYDKLKHEIDTNIQKVLQHRQFIMGPEVQELECQLASTVGVKNVISCASGTDALQILFMSYDIGLGDAVFCPSVTFIASVEPAAMLGATPVFCDITEDTYNLSPFSLEEQISNVKREGKHKPKAVVAVDFLGNPADYNQIKEICKKNNLILVEDAAQAFGSQYQGKMCCSFGNAATTSFFPAKPLGCYGDGGAIFTDNDELAELCHSIRVHGKGSSKYDNIRIGLNSRLDTIQAAILLPKLKALKDYEMNQRQIVADRYNKSFHGYLQIPTVSSGNKSAYAQYAVLANSEKERDGILESLNRELIPNMIYYPYPQHKLIVNKDNPYLGISFENAEKYCNTTFSLPMHPYLKKGEQDLIIQTVIKAVRAIRK